DNNDLVEILFPLLQRPQPSDKFRASFGILNARGQGSFRSIDVVPDFKAGGPRIDLDCKDGLLVDLQADNPSLEDISAEKDYYESRLIELAKWLKSIADNPQRIARIRIESLSKANISEYAIRAFSVVPSTGGQSGAGELDVARALSSQKASICLELHERLP